MASQQCTLFVDFWIKPDRIEEFKQAHRPVWEACGKEPELLLFDVFHDPQDPGHLRFVEVWNASREWFETEQMTKSYYTTLWEKSTPTWIKPPQLQYMVREGEGCSYRGEYLRSGVCRDQ